MQFETGDRVKVKDNYPKDDPKTREESDIAQRGREGVVDSVGPIFLDIELDGGDLLVAYPEEVEKVEATG